MPNSWDSGLWALDLGPFFSELLFSSLPPSAQNLHLQGCPRVDTCHYGPGLPSLDLRGLWQSRKDFGRLLKLFGTQLSHL